MLLIGGCSGPQRIVVGSKNFTEQVVLGEMIAQQVEARLQVSVDRKFNLGGTLLAHEALKNGGIDLYPEYTGTALTAILRAPVNRDSSAVLRRVRQDYRPWGLEWLDPLGFDNTFAMVVRTDLARRLSLSSISDAAKTKHDWRLGVGFEFVQRADGLAGLMQTYKLGLSGAPTTMDLGLLYSALQANRIEMAAASATDAQLSRPEFAALDDDQHYFPPYECAIVVRSETLARVPGLRDALSALSGRIKPDDMRRLNAAVDLQRRPVADVVREYLKN